MNRIRSIARAIGVEGAFLAAGIALLAIGASYIHPAAPAIVVGVSLLALGVALALPEPDDIGDDL